MTPIPMAKQVEVRVHSVDREAFTVDADVSDESVDRDGEIILLSAWVKRLPEYLKNPLLCWMHPIGFSFEQRQPEDILGKAIHVEVGPASLFCRFQYAVRENPKAEMCFNLIAGDYLRSYSIGAIPYGPIWSDAPEIVLNMLPEPAREALRAGDAWCVHTDMELLEVSNVFVGSNREALARACRDGVISKSLAPELFRSINAGSGKQWPVQKQLAPAPGFVSTAEFSALQSEVKSLRELIESNKAAEAEATPDPEPETAPAEAIVQLSAEQLFSAVLGRL